MASHDNRHHGYLFAIVSVRCTGALPSWKLHWLFSNFPTIGQRIWSKMSMYLAELIFPATSVIVPIPSIQMHPRYFKHTCTAITTLYKPRNCVFHIFSNFRKSFSNTTCIASVDIMYPIVLALSSVDYFGSIAQNFSFQRNCQCFRNNSSVKSILTQSSLNWLYAYQIWNR